MELTAENVSTVFEDCLYKDGEDTADHVKVEGIMMDIGFNPKKLEQHKQEIIEMLMELPDAFKTSGGGGHTFLYACNTKEDRQWGEHRNMEQLMLLGLGTGQAAYCLPREIWSSLPGGMPYFAVIDVEPKKEV